MRNFNIRLCIKDDHDAPPEIGEACSEIGERKSPNLDRLLFWLIFLVFTGEDGPRIWPNLTNNKAKAMRTKDTAITISPLMTVLTDVVPAKASIPPA